MPKRKFIYLPICILLKRFRLKAVKFYNLQQTKLGLSNLIVGATPSHAKANNDRIPTCENAIALPRLNQHRYLLVKVLLLCGNIQSQIKFC